ncbi:MAG: hypothetical protein Q9220_005673 [cf. Caloplaca sp. 1 TL-2023]
MASSLPHDVGVSKPSKPAKGRLSTLATDEHALDTAYGSEGTLSARKRATTNATNAAGPRSLFDRRSKPGSQPQAPANLPHLDLRIKTDPFSFLKEHDNPQQPSSSSRRTIPTTDHSSSAPIPIPLRKSRSSQPTTPLTGRERTFFHHSPKLSHTPPGNPNSRGFTPSPGSQSQSSQSEQEPFAQSPIRQRAMKTDRDPASPIYKASPLSPTMPIQPMAPILERDPRLPTGGQPSRRQPGTLAVPFLPPFHPANYEPSPRTIRPASASHGRQLSDAQKRLYQQQRELAASSSRSNSYAAVKSPVDRPSSPRLGPTGSPGPVTPLMLEGQSDYFLTGSGTATAVAARKHERRDVMERLISVETDRVRHPERVERHSPAVSPAVGHV